ncbi:MAG: Ig-like domain-containing domain, partial [Planctomycetota bacterium]
MDTFRGLSRLGALLPVLAVLSCAHGTPSPSNFAVVSITPADGTTAVSATTSVQIEFNADVHPDSVIGTTSIYVVDDKNWILRGSFTVSGTLVTFNPSGSLEADSTYGIAVKRTVCDLEGVPLQYPKAALFSTGASIVPIAGFPPFDIYPLAPDATKIVAEIQGASTLVAGSADAVERPGADPVHANARNVTQDGPCIAGTAAADGSFQITLPGGSEGDLIEVSASFPANGKTGPSVTVTAYLPFTWALVGAAGTAPSARQGHTAVYDPDNGRMIVFGGITNTLGVGQPLMDCHELTLTGGSEAWAVLSPPSPPPARWGHTAVFETTKKRMIVFGGDTGFLGVLNDVWALDLTTGAEAWAPLSPS